MDFLTLAKERYSVRKFDTKPVPDELLDKILEAGRLAPTARNTQGHKIFVLKSEEARMKAKECSPCTFDAPIVMVICGKKPTPERRSFAEMDASIVTTHMMLEAADLGLGSTWVGMYDPEKTTAMLELTEDMVPLCFLPIGYPAEDAVPAEMHNSRKPLSETVVIL